MSEPNLVLDQLAALHRRRQFAQDQRKRSDLALGSFLRMMLGWRLDLPEDEREAIRKEALRLHDIGNKLMKAQARQPSKPVPEANDPIFRDWEDVIMASLTARLPYDAIEARAGDEMKRLVVTLPVWSEFAEAVKGLGALSVAGILAETGDLSLYPTKGHVWKRMGVAVMDGVRQGGLPKNAAAEDWIAHGYSRRRRSLLWVVGDILIKTSGSPYGDLYRDRKAVEIAKAEAKGLKVLPSAKISPKLRDEAISAMHIHRRAQRYMEKCLLRDLWQVWRREITPDVPHQNEVALILSPDATVPAGDHPTAVEETTHQMSPAGSP